MNFHEAEQFLLSLSNLPRKEYMKDPKKCDIYLKRMQFFLDVLGNPEKKIPHYIHVGGTSGKGSVVNFLHSILHESGKKIGSTVSPHPTTMNERWRIGNSTMTKKEFVEIVEYLKPKLDEYARIAPYGIPSFFELTTVVAFVYFARKRVNWAIIEVGCGGRFDSANILKSKDVAIITNIGLDHTEILGDTKEKIAWEKAGIIKSGCKVFTMEKNKKVLAVIEKECKKNKVDLNIQNSKFKIQNSNLSSTTFQHKNNSYTIPTIGVHQIKNAVLCINVALSIGISKKMTEAGLKKAKQPLRMEIVSEKPLIILDGAHNPDKMKTTVSTMCEIRKNAKVRNIKSNNSTIQQFNNLNIIVGFSGNKDIAVMLRQLSKLNPSSVACTRNTINAFRKVANPGDIAKKIKKIFPKTKVEIFLDPIDALKWSKKQTKKNDLLLATGSLFLSGEVRKHI